MFKYPIRIVNEPGQVFNVARFDATSKSSSAASSLFKNGNISMDFVNVGQEGKIEKSGNNSSDEEAAAPKKKGWSRAKSEIPSMRRARERKLFLKEQSTGEEKFTGLKDGKLGEDTYVCVFHKQHQCFYLYPCEKAYKFTKTNTGNGITYGEAISRLGQVTKADERFNKFKMIGRGEGNDGNINNVCSKLKKSSL